jgi:DNA-binding response OmpR family regulator
MLSTAQAPPAFAASSRMPSRAHSRAQPSNHHGATPLQAGGAQLHVALFDGDRRFTQRLAAAMRDAGWQTSILSDLPDRQALLTINADVLVVDLAATNADAMWLTRQIIDTPEIAIVACTERSSVAQRVRSLHEGADGWITKPCEPPELLARIQAIARARRSASSEARPSICRGDIEISHSRYDAIAHDHSAGLTTREFEVLETLAVHDGVALRRERICASVWGDHVPAGDRSVDIFVGRIRFKLKRISPDWRYLHTHPGVGYRFAAEPVAAVGGAGGGGQESQ